MEIKIPLGVKHHEKITVGEADSAKAFGSGMVDVFATPAMIALMEKTSHMAAAPSRMGIQILLSKEFLKWVLLSNMIAWPVSYFVLQKWLQNFAYRTSIGIGDFVLAGGIVFAVAMITVSGQSLRAASADPVKSLRHE